jgi:hypothetical protein
MSTTDTRNGQKSGDRMAELLAQAERRHAVCEASGYNAQVLENIWRGEAWARQDTGLVPMTKVSKTLVKKALKQARKLRLR